MEKQNNFDIGVIFTCIAAFISAKLGFCGWLFFVLLMFMTIDFITGLTAAGLKGETSSKAGWKGAIKKTGYFALVSVGVGCDWVISNAFPAIGIQFSTKGIIAALVMIWLLSVEFISIIENYSEMGLPVPPFLKKLISAIKSVTEKAGDSIIEQKESAGQ